MEVLAGSYDGLVVAYRLDVGQDSSTSLKVTQRFNDVSHNGCVRVMAVSEKGIVASGSTDESVRLFDLLRNSDIGSLVSHEGDVNSLKFMGKDFLYTASSDGTIKMWRTRIWELQRTLKGHKGAVLGFDIHPSKKLALSVGGDKKLIAWDLVAGKYSFIRNIKKVYETLVFSPSGSRFLLRTGTTVEAYDLTQTEPIYVQDLKSHVNDCAFLSDELFVTADDTGKVKVWSIPVKKMEFEFYAHEARVRSVVPLRSSDKSRFVIASCSGQDETIKAWSVSISEMKATLVAWVATGCRLTCLTVHSTPEVADQLLNRPPVEQPANSVDSEKDSQSTTETPPETLKATDGPVTQELPKKKLKNSVIAMGSKKKKVNDMKKRKRNQPVAGLQKTRKIK